MNRQDIISSRKEQFKRNEKLESLIKELNELLEPVQSLLNKKVEGKEPEVLFIVGVPRSGTTLFLQWLAQSGHFGYVSNFISRFYRAPAIGLKIQKMIFDPAYQFADEMSLDRDWTFTFESNLGKTAGVLSPNEFWYFWRSFFTRENTHPWAEGHLDQTKIAQFKQILTSLQEEFQKPLALKAMIVNGQISLLAKHLLEARFVFIKRDPIANMASLLEARKKFYGNIESWYSFKPDALQQVEILDPFQQVAAQVYFTLKEIEQELSQLSVNRYLVVQYEAFCQNPHQVWRNLLKLMHMPAELPYRGPSGFANSNQKYLSDYPLAQQLQEAAQKYFTLNVTTEGA